MSKKNISLIAIACVLIGVFVFFKWTPFGANLLSSMSQSGWLFPLVTIAAIIDSINPCALSILFITVAFLMSLGKSRSRIILIGGLYVFGIFLVYLLIGLGLLQALHLFNIPHFMSKAAAVVLVLFGLINIINHYFPKFPIKLKIPDMAHHSLGKLIEKASLPSAFGLGFLVGLFEFPCTGGPYLLVLGLLHDHSTYLKGFIYLFYYNLVFVLPLLVILFLASDPGFYVRLDAWRKSENPILKIAMGALMILLGFVMFVL